jgi:hypothetical protein
MMGQSVLVEREFYVMINKEYRSLQNFLNNGGAQGKLGGPFPEEQI